VAIFGIRRHLLKNDEAQSEGALLSSAYNQHRSTELRLYGGDPVPVFSPTLGASDTATSIEMDKLQLRVDEHLKANPNDAYWRQMSGRLLLLKGSFKAALAEFESASALNPNLPGLKLDMAAAYFEKGDATRDPTQYDVAADLYQRIVKDPAELAQRSSANYNLGLCWDRRHNYDSAVKAYQAALDLERNPAWRREIQEKLDKAKNNRQQGEINGSQHLDLSPAAFLRELEQDPDRAREDYESYLGEAARDWFTVQGSSPEAANALQKLAEIGLIHQDAWLHDMLRSPQNDASREAAEDLSQALGASLQGRADQALAASTHAAKLYERSGNHAGLLRARVEMTYSMQRMGRSQECLRLAEKIKRDRKLQQYSWLSGFFLLEEGACHSSNGDMVALKQGATQALELSRADGFPLQVLRAQGFLVDGLEALGQTQAAWTLAGRGLEDSVHTRGAPMATYQFLHSIYVATQYQGLLWAASDVADAAAQASTLATNKQIQAYAQEVLGTAETAVGQTAEADKAFSAATNLLHTLPPGRARNLYSADWEADRSALLAREGRLPEALLRMQQAEPAIAATDNYSARQHHYIEFANLLLSAGRPAEALDRMFFAIQDAEQALAVTSNETEKLSWERRTGPSYRLFVQCLVEMGKPQEALQAWEWYHSAPYRKAIQGEAFLHSTKVLPTLTSASEDRRNELIIVIARLQDFYVAWTISSSSSNPVRMVKLVGSPAQMAATVHTLTELCSDRNSSQSDIQIIGGNLYHDLLSPFDDQIQMTRQLWLDVDTSLQGLPFAALTRNDHYYLNDTHSVVFLPGWWTLHPPAADTVSPSANALLVEGALSVPGPGSLPTATLPAEYLESSGVARHFSHARLIQSQQSSSPLLRKLLPDAEVFHFSGHTFTNGDQTGLLLKYPDTIFSASSLDGISLRRSRLAVLATCSSAGGTQYGMEDTSSLAHALLTAGVSNVVATLWDVDSQASRIMMLQFYDLLTQSSTVPAAIHAAQLKVRADPATRHPFFWSAVQVYTQ
jgi:CHAT domain-containing protein